MMHEKSSMTVKATIAAAVLLLAVQTPVLAAENPYILLLPMSSEIEYNLDSELISEEYSSDKYMILLYEPGDAVSFQVTTDYTYSLEDAATGDAFEDYSVSGDGWISFDMPEIDLCFILGTEYRQESEETEPASETPETSEEPDSGMEIVLHGYGYAEVTMTDGTVLTISDGEVFQTNDHVDLFNVYQTEGFSESPIFTIRKNGSVLEDDSGVIINRGSYLSHYTVDLKNGLDLSNFYSIDVTNPESAVETTTAEEEEALAEAETEAAAEEEETVAGAEMEDTAEAEIEDADGAEAETAEEESSETEAGSELVMVGATVIPTSPDVTVKRGEDFTFRVELQEGYSKTDDFAVKANGEVLAENEDGTYTVSDVTDNQVITLEGIADITAPEIEIFLNGEEATIQADEDRYTFTEPVTVWIDASDVASGLETLQYALSSGSDSEAEDITEWNNYTGEITIEGPGEQILYTKAVDAAGNEADQATAILVGSIRQAPIVFASAETVAGKADGHISGLDTTMEYSSYGADYTGITDPDMAFAAGTYEVRYAADEEDLASESAVVTVEEGRELAVVFIAGTEIVDVIEVDYGEGIPDSDIPDIPEREGYDWEDATWDADSFEDFTEDTIIRAVYPETEFKISFSTDLMDDGSDAADASGQTGTDEDAGESEEKEETKEPEEETAGIEETEEKKTAARAGDDYEFSMIIFGDITAEVELADGSTEYVNQEDALTLTDLVEKVVVSSAVDPEILLSQDGVEVTEEDGAYTQSVDADGHIILTFDEEITADGTYVLIVSE